ncbi:aldo/keto reductase [Agromyces sp. SYSU T0242]|uniref:aldo/keto reductase n=1 Tax=Agromyces litoreus TaxID=3158561 RepID=UPI003391E569
MMRTREVRGLPLTELGLGMAQLGNLYRETTDEEARSAIDASWDAGVRLFDTAPHYGLGLSEERAGRILGERPRDEFVLSTKVGRVLVPNPDGAGALDDEGFAVPATRRRVRDHSRDGVRRSIDASLGRLGLDRIDIAYLHDPEEGSEASALDEALPALAELRDEGVLGAIGVGTKDAGSAARLTAGADLDLVMIAGRYTLLDASAEAELFPAAARAGTAIVAVGAYNSGILGRERPGADGRYEYGSAPADLVDRARRIADVCEAHGTTLPAAAIAFCLRHPLVVSVVLGARNGAQARANAERHAAGVPDDLWTELDERGLLPDAENQEAPA